MQFNINSIDEINHTEKIEYKSLLFNSFLIQIGLFFVFLFVMYNQEHIVFNNISSIFDFPFSEHFLFLFNSVGLLIVIFLIVVVTIFIFKQFLLEMKNDNKYIGLIVAIVGTGVALYSFLKQYEIMKIFDFSSSSVIGDYWQNLRDFFMTPSDFVILSETFFYYLEFTSWLIITIFLIKNIIIYNKEKKYLSFNFYQFKTLFLFTFLVFLINIIKTYYVLVLTPSFLEYFVLMSLIIILNGVFENINMSLSKFESLELLKSHYSYLYVVLICILLSTIYMFSKIYSPGLFDLYLEYNLSEVLKFTLIGLFLIMLYPIVKYYYMTNYVINNSETILDGVKTYFTVSLIVLCTFLNLQVLLPLINNTGTFTLDSSIQLIFSLLFSFSIIYLARIFSTKEIIIFSTFVWVYFLAYLGEVIVNTIISILISSVFMLLLFIINKVISLIKDKDNYSFLGLPLIVLYGPFVLLFTFFLESTLSYIVFWAIVLLCSLISHYTFKFVGKMLVKL